LCKTFVLRDISPMMTGSAYPTSVGVRVEEIEVSCDRGKRSCSSKDVMAGFRGDLIKHVDEV
jgi:hypothetical protein